MPIENAEIGRTYLFNNRRCRIIGEFPSPPGPQMIRYQTHDDQPSMVGEMGKAAFETLATDLPAMQVYSRLMVREIYDMKVLATDGSRRLRFENAPADWHEHLGIESVAAICELVEEHGGDPDDYNAAVIDWDSIALIQKL